MVNTFRRGMIILNAITADFFWNVFVITGSVKAYINYCIMKSETAYQ